MAAPTHRLSNFIDLLLKPFVTMQPSYIKDDWHFIRELPEQIDFECTLFSCDIVNLYTTITHELGLEAINYWLNKYPEMLPERFSKEFGLKSILFILTNNNFIFDNVMYTQLIGTAIGTKIALPYACLTIGYLELTKLFPRLSSICSQINSDRIYKYFKRYMEDGFKPLPQEIDQDKFLELLNSMHPNIKYTMEAVKVYSDKQLMNFLDITVI